ncbi:hypothetical protein CFP56_008701 [Quercus suber]|uniref:Uncharacterized protein n=1 Tax=Quercus suber TaxID=58331 RepID=A0AAW0M8A2_QUESU
MRGAWKHTEAAASHDPKRGLQKLQLKVYLPLEMYRIHYNNSKKLMYKQVLCPRERIGKQIFFGYIMFKLWWIDIEPSSFLYSQCRVLFFVY